MSLGICAFFEFNANSIARRQEKFNIHVRKMKGRKKRDLFSVLKMETNF